MTTKITAETPIPLMLEALRANTAWGLMVERLTKLRDHQMQILIMSRHDMAATEVRQIIGYCRGLNDILLEPHKLEAEWKRLTTDAQKKVQRA